MHSINYNNMTAVKSAMTISGLVDWIVSLLFFTSGVIAGTKTSVFGFEFGMSVKEAKEIIKGAQKRILMDEKDNKGMRTVMFEGVVENLPFSNIKRSESELEFFEGKLMSYSLVIEPGEDIEVMKNKVLEYLNTKYGNYKEHESMFFYDVWTWEIPDLKLVLGVNSNKERLKVDYIYLPLEAEKVAEELDKKRKGKPEDPARQMFIEGNYSKPRNYTY